MKQITDSYFTNSEEELAAEFQMAFESWTRAVGSEYSQELQKELLLRLNQLYDNLAAAADKLDLEEAKVLAHRFTGLYMFGCHQSDTKLAAKRLEVYLDCSNWARAKKCLMQLRRELDCLQKVSEHSSFKVQSK